MNEYNHTRHSSISTNEYNKAVRNIGKWVLVDNNSIMSIQPIYRCSVCNKNISTYYPPSVCEYCGSFNVITKNI
jgi:rRNA maturation endonuclease Nob1